MMSIVLLLLASVSDCDLQQPQLVLSIETTPCFGQCPVFEFKIYSNCKATYIGKSHVKMEGEWHSKLSLKQYRSLRDTFNESNYFGFDDRYTAEITDLPTTYIYYTDGNQKKKIMDYYDAPEELKMLEEKVYDLIENLNWKPKLN